MYNIMAKNYHSSTMSAIFAFFIAFTAGVTLAEEIIALPSDYEDDLYHCKDPMSNQNLIRCDPTTFLWDIGDLNPSIQPDDSLLCQEVVKILVRAREEEGLEPGQKQQKETKQEVQLWETIMETSVVDQLEPCVLWAMSFGPLAPWASSMGFDEQKNKQNDNSDPMSSMLETEFDQFMIALAWSTPLPEPFSLDRSELHEITGRHMLDALKAELGPDKVDHLGLTVTAGVPDYEAQILPLTLSGKVVFLDHREALGSSNLQKLLLQKTFVDDNARDLYLFRLRISQDQALQMVSTVIAGKDTIADYMMGEPSRINNEKKQQQIIDTNLSEADEKFVSALLVAILSAVGAAIVAVVCFAYFLIFRSRTSGNAKKTLQEHGSESGSSRSYRKVSKKSIKESFQDGIPAVKTAPTAEDKEEESVYDIEYMAGSNDGVSEYDMDTLPPPSTLPDSDDDRSVVMSVIEGFEDENAEEAAETVAGHTLSDDSDANASLYSYIPTDTSLSTKEESVLQKAQKKGVLWSVERHARAPMDSDTDDYGFSIGPSSTKKNRTSMLGPSTDSDSQSRDSDSLLYGTDDDDDLLMNDVSNPNTTQVSLDYDQEETQPSEQHPPIVESASSDDLGDKKKKFEDLWKDENETDEAASVLNYLDSVQSARRSTEDVEVAPTTSLKIIDVATPVQTPERPMRPEGNKVEVSGEQLVEALVDTVPAATSDENKMNLPLPATLDATFQDNGSVSSSLSGSSSTNKYIGESVRKPSSSKWATSSPSAGSLSDNSIRSSDSAMLRSLLGQGDMNDAALFGKEQQKEDNSTSSSNTALETVSMTSCTSGKLQSLLLSESREVASDDEEDLLFDKKATAHSSRNVEEEKKEPELEYDDDEDDRKSNYLPASMTPRGQVPAAGIDQTPDDASVYSALSEAPSVDETIASNMGWF